MTVAQTARRGAVPRTVGCAFAVASVVIVNVAATDPSPANAMVERVTTDVPRPKGKVAPGLAVAAGLPVRSPTGASRAAFAADVLRDAAGRLVVDISIDDDGVRSLPAVTALGAEVIATDAGPTRATLAVTADTIAAIAAVSGVTYVEGVAPPIVASVPRAPRPSEVIAAAACGDRVVSEGDVQLRAAQARSTYGVDGSGVRVGIVSDSYDALGGAAGDVADGELPGAGNPCGRTAPVVVQSEGADDDLVDEGRAMAQLVHDLAPGAELAVATAVFGELDMADQIRALGLGGADVVTDDILWTSEPLYQEGPIGVAIRENRELRDIPHFTSAGNSNVIVGGKHVGSYEAPVLRLAACPGFVTSFDPAYTACHDFDPGAAIDVRAGITLANGGSVSMLLGWSEPRNGVTTDVDIFLRDTVTNALVAGGIDANRANGHPNETMSHTNTTGASRTYEIIVARYDAGPSSLGTPRFRHAMVRSRGVTAVEYDTSAGGDVVGPTLLGHAAAAPAVSTAAVPYFDSSTPEPFSSRGPAATCWQPFRGDAPSAPITPCSSADVDIAATDGAATSFFGSPDGAVFRFFGTSAAAPHAAAVAALVHDRTTCASAAQIEGALTSTAAKVGTAGTSAVGAGLVDAVGALGALGRCPTIAPVPDQTVGSGPASVQIGLTVTDPDTSAAGLVTTAVSSNSTVLPSTSLAIAGPGTAPTLTIAPPIGVTGSATVTLTVTDSSGLTDSTQFRVTVNVDDGTVVESLTPARFADSRDEPTFDGRLRGTGTRAANSTWEIEIAGRGHVPDDAVGAVVNVTIVNGEAPGFATVYPCGTLPVASSLNYAPGTVEANELVAKLSPQGTICVYTLAAADVIVDVVGFLPAGTSYTPLTPLRFADSRNEPTFDGGMRNTGPRAAGTTWEIPITGRGGVPDDATTVVANVTVTNGEAEGFATIHPCGRLPVTSSLNYGPGVTRPNEVIARLSPRGTLCVFTFSTVDVIVDVVGFVGDEPGFVSTSPQRFADSRDEPTFDAGLRNTGRRPAGATWEIPVAGRGSVPADATTVVANVTVTNGQAEGFATVHPCGTLPTASSLNYAPGVTRPNELVARLSPQGTLCIYTFSEVDVIVDIAGHDRPHGSG